MLQIVKKANTFTMMSELRNCEGPFESIRTLLICITFAREVLSLIQLVFNCLVVSQHYFIHFKLHLVGSSTTGQ